MLELKALNDIKCVSFRFKSVDEIDNIKKALTTSLRILANLKHKKKIDKKKDKRKNRRKA